MRNPSACHRISSFTSAYGSVCSVKLLKVPAVFNSRAMSRTSASVARIGPDPTLTRATPSACSSAIGGVPFIARMLIGPPMPRTSAPMVSRSQEAGDEDAVGAGGQERLAAIDGDGETRFGRADRPQEHIGARVDDDADAGLVAADRAMVVIFSHWSGIGSRSVVPGTRSSTLMPTAPAAITRSTTSATASGVAAYACSMSAVTGTLHGARDACRRPRSFRARERRRRRDSQAPRQRRRSSSRSRESLQPRRAGRGGVPGIRKDEDWRPLMQGAKLLGFVGHSGQNTAVISRKSSVPESQSSAPLVSVPVRL